MAGASDVSTRVLDSSFEDEGGLQESLIVFDDTESATRLETLDLEEPSHVFEHLDIAWTFLDADQLEAVAAGCRSVASNGRRSSSGTTTRPPGSP
jgi:hypothetical protein